MIVRYVRYVCVPVWGCAIASDKYHHFDFGANSFSAIRQQPLAFSTTKVIFSLVSHRHLHYLVSFSLPLSHYDEKRVLMVTITIK